MCTEEWCGVCIGRCCVRYVVWCCVRCVVWCCVRCVVWCCQVCVCVLWLQETQFVLAVLDYDAIEETLLRFSTGAVIKLLPKEGQDKGT